MMIRYNGFIISYHYLHCLFWLMDRHLHLSLLLMGSTGDQLSPFLFILVLEVLGCSLKAISLETRIKGIWLFGYDLSLTHQQCMDNTLGMWSPMVQEAQEFTKFMELCSTSLGMDINKNKFKYIYLTQKIFSNAMWVKFWVSKIVNTLQNI